MWLLSSQTRERAALTCLFSSIAKKVFRDFALCQGAFAFWSLVPAETSLLFLPPSPVFADIQSSSSALPDPLVLL